MKFKLSRYIGATKLPHEQEIYSKHIIFSTRTGKSLLMNYELYNQLMNGAYEVIPTDMLLKLFNYEIIVPEHENEFQTMMTQNRIGIDESASLGITIQPTSNCQLGCHYCGQVHTKHTMNNIISEKVLQRIETKLQTGKYKSLNITWYGGEPLMGYSQLTHMSIQLDDISKKYGIHYSAHMITNGLSLKPDIFKELYLLYHVHSFQITIDGTPEHHDKRRVTKTGASTFDIILNNIVSITQLPEYTARINKPLFIRMNIDQTNYESIPFFIDLLAEKQLHNKVSLSFAAVVNWGQVKSGDEIGLTKEHYAELEIEWLIYAMNKGFSVEDILPDRSYQPCMVVMQDSEVYDAYGNIYPCYEFSYTPMYEKDEYKIGNIKLSAETYNKHAITRDWFDDLEAGKSWCKECNFLPVCEGGCPKKWYQGEPGCPSFKFNMEDRMALQYILKHNAESLSNLKEYGDDR